MPVSTIRIAVRLQIDPQAASIHADFTGSSLQVKGSVNAVRAAEYWEWFRENAGDDLEPGRLHRVELRF